MSEPAPVTPNVRAQLLFAQAERMPGLVHFPTPGAQAE
jgi:hypothetical protein